MINNSIVTGEPSTIYGDVVNNGSITSQPDRCAVEVPCVVDGNRIKPTNLSVQDLTVAALTGQRIEHIYQVAKIDTHTAAELDLDEIWAMTDELISRHGDWLPDWLAGNVEPRTEAVE